ncbi:MAG TPA: hypothetical protein VN950_07850 [Terriglobales bacterium]|nr:hypothetical protein [Terriglobales bacterium]
MTPKKWNRLVVLLVLITFVGGSFTSATTAIPSALRTQYRGVTASSVAYLPPTILYAAVIVTAAAIVVASEGTTLTATPAEAALTQVAAGATATGGDKRAALADTSLVLLSDAQASQLSKETFDN